MQHTLRCGTLVSQRPSSFDSFVRSTTYDTRAMLLKENLIKFQFYKCFQTMEVRSVQLMC